MTRVISFPHDSGEVDIIFRDEVSETDNVFTIIVGKNGIGKSRLLADIARYVAKLGRGISFYERVTSPYIFAGEGYYLKGNVIAVSTSPFDKFPTARRRSLGDGQVNYKYIGMRGEGPFGATSSISLISSAAISLLEKLHKGRSNDNLVKVFGTLGFKPSVEFIVKPTYIGREGVRNSAKISEDASLYIDLLAYERDHEIIIDEKYQDALQKMNLSTRHKVLHAVRVIHNVTERKTISLAVDFLDGLNRIEGDDTSKDFIAALLVLLKYNFVKLMDLRLHKIFHGDMSLKLASSGEQCLLVIMLGIAGNIDNDSLVLIDEPEISLHPRWQEEFMQLLISAFSGYRGCQFIIATHSPQLISRLMSKHCFITSLSQGKTYRANDFVKKSADYQLAELFDAPGMMNEYISRLAFNLLAKIKFQKKMDDELRSDLSHLMDLKKKIDIEDPLVDLIDSVVEACGLYANNK